MPRSSGHQSNSRGQRRRGRKKRPKGTYKIFNWPDTNKLTIDRRGSFREKAQRSGLVLPERDEKGRFKRARLARHFVPGAGWMWIEF